MPGVRGFWKCRLQEITGGQKIEALCLVRRAKFGDATDSIMACPVALPLSNAGRLRGNVYGPERK